MLERVRAWLSGDGRDDAELLHRHLEQLQDELRAVEWRQQRMQQDVDGVRPETVAIEEKVDVARLSSEIERLRRDDAQTQAVEEQLAGIREEVAAQDEDVAEVATRIEARVHDALEGLREELRTAFHRELVALETVLAYEMDAMEAREQWQREDLEERIEAVRDAVRAVEEDAAGAEAETVALLELNTARLEEELDGMRDRLSGAQDQIVEEVEGAFDAVEERSADGEQAEVGNVRDTLPVTLEEAVGTVIEEDIRPLEEAVAGMRSEVDERVAAYREELDAVKERVREQEARRQELQGHTDRLEEQLGRLSSDFSTVRDRVEGVVSSDDLSAVRSGVEQLRAELEDRVAAEAVDDLQGLIDALQEEVNALEEGKADVGTLQDAIEDVSGEIGGVQDDLIAIGTRLRDRMDELSEAAVDQDELAEQVGTLSAAIDGARERIGAIRDRFEQEVESLQEGKADSTHVEEALDDVRSDIVGMEQALEDVGGRVRALQEGKVDRTAFEDAVGTVADELVGLRDRVEDMQATLERRVEMLAEEKADREAVTEQMNTLAEGVRTVRERVEQSRDTLTSRLDELEDAAARAESVTDIHRHINALDDEAAARQKAVHEAVKEIHVELDDLREQHLTQADIDELQHRVQKIREQQERTLDPDDAVSRTEFSKLRSTVEDLMDLVMDVLNRE